MSCYHPLHSFDTGLVNPETGKRILVTGSGKLDLYPVHQASKKIRRHIPFDGTYQRMLNGVRFLSTFEEVPCGKCIGCRLDYSRMWAIRCVLESTGHGCSSFITLTYDDEHLPGDFRVSKPTWQKFLKRLRSAIAPTRIRFFATGEYGSKSARPHYHAIIFGYDFPDKYPWSKCNGNVLFRSPMLERLWPYGQSLIGEVSFNSCAYVARYVMKKTKDNGEFQPFLDMSRRPGIGCEYLKANMSKLLDLPKVYGDFGNSHEYFAPKYFDYLLDKDPALAEVKEAYKAYKRRLAEEAKSLDSTRYGSADPLEYKESIKKAEVNRLERRI